MVRSNRTTDQLPIVSDPQPGQQPSIGFGGCWPETNFYFYALHSRQSELALAFTFPSGFLYEDCTLHVHSLSIRVAFVR